MSLNEFCRMSGISQSTVYKILEERREPNLRTVRDIVKALNQIYRRDTEKFLAVIASPTFMEGLPKQLDTVSNGVVSIREYTVSTVEDAILTNTAACPKSKKNTENRTTFICNACPSCPSPNSTTPCPFTKSSTKSKKPLPKIR